MAGLRPPAGLAPKSPADETGGMTRLGKRHARTPLGAALVACLGVIAALAVAPGPATAVAAVTWTIKPGGSVTAMSGKATFKDTATGSIFTCLSVSMTGTLKSGSGLSGSGGGSISAVTFTNCTSPLGLVIPLKAAGLPWHVNLSSESSGVVTGSISHMQMVDKSAPCNFVLDGTGGTARDGHVKFRYTDGTGRLQVLTTGGGLHYYAVAGCAGLFNTGDPGTLSDTFALSPRQAITSP